MEFSAELPYTTLLELVQEQAPVHDWTAPERAWLLDECREKKEGLHPNTRRIAIDLERAREGAGEVIISTGAFYDSCRPLVERTIAALEYTLQGSTPRALDWAAVAAIYLVGGSSA